jgi:hypothetical protein
MAAAKKGGAFFPVFFGMVGILFIGILLFVYRAVAHNRPVLLDEHGRAVDAARQ